MFSETTATKKIISLKKRIRAVPGGTSASKTISILLYLIARAQSDKKATLTSIVSESFPHLRRCAMRDFLTILKEHNYFRDKRWDITNSVYTFETGSQIEFFSVDQPEKVRGARRDRLFINEANNIPFSAFEELEVRTKEFIFLDWNPTNEFWYYTDVKDKRNDVEELRSEANNIPFSAFEELEVRTKEFIFLDWNPTNEFWYYTDVKDKRNDVEELTLT